MPFAAVRRHATIATLNDAILTGAIAKLVAERGLNPLPHSIVVYYDNPSGKLLNNEVGITVDVGLLLKEPFPGDLALRCIHTPGGRAACCRHLGPYENLRTVHTAIVEWCAANGEDITGLNWEHYGQWNADPKRRLTEVFYLLR